MSTQICNPCAEGQVCLDNLDRYSLQDDVYYFVLNCPPNFFCGGNNVMYLVCCDGTIEQTTFTAGMTAAQRQAAISALVGRCMMKEAFCDGDGGPGGGGGDGTNGDTPGNDPNNPLQLYGNRPMSSTSYCADGSPFTYTVPAGLFFARTQAAADAAARNYARTLSSSLKICLTGPLRTCCNNTAYSSTMVASGGVGGNFRWSVIGSLPTGLVAIPIGRNGLRIQGIPTTNGNYTFTVRATDAAGNFMAKVITIRVWGIADATLPDGALAADYDYQLTSTNGTAPYTYTLVSGGFPLGVDITSTGLITGVVGEEGVFSPVIRVTDSAGRTCTKEFTLTVPVAPTYRIVYWTMEESLLSDRVDSVESLHAPAEAQSVSWADHTATAIGIDAGAGLFGNGCRMAKGLQNTWINGGFIGPFTTIGRVRVNNSGSLRQDGNGLSFCFWLKVNVLNTVPVFLEYIKNGSFKTTLEFRNTYCRCVVNDTGVVHSENIPLPIPTVGAWTFYELYHDPVAGKMGAVINNSTDYPSSFTPVITASVNGTFTVVMNSTNGAFNSTFDATDAQDFIVDEVLIRMDSRLTVAQRAYLYNGGVGRTWPIVLP